jgi:hypothetical protein
MPKRLPAGGGETEGSRPEEPEEPDTASGERVPRGVWGFKVAYVFDIAQTEGEDLPAFATVQGEPAAYLDRMRHFIRAEGITLTYARSLSGALGVSRGGHIEILEGQTSAEEFRVLAHELAHELLHKTPERKGDSKTIKETEAEAVAFVVCQAIGLETGTASSDYIQLYRGDTATLAASLQYIQETANRILSAVAAA